MPRYRFEVELDVSAPVDAVRVTRHGAFQFFRMFRGHRGPGADLTSGDWFSPNLDQCLPVNRDENGKLIRSRVVNWAAIRPAEMNGDNKLTEKLKEV